MEKTVWVLEWDCNLEGVFPSREAALARAIKFYQKWIGMERNSGVEAGMLVDGIVADLDSLLKENCIDGLCYIMELPYYEKEED